MEAAARFSGDDNVGGAPLHGLPIVCKAGIWRCTGYVFVSRSKPPVRPHNLI
jgi:hypothetical protein